MRTPGVAARVSTMAAMVCALVNAGTLDAKTIYVSPSGSDANDGLSWATARRSVEHATILAVPGDQMWIAAGTYVGIVAVRAGVALYGGFTGTETQLAERDWVANETILQGLPTDVVIGVFPDTTANTRIDGFTLRGGGGAHVGANYLGGAIYCINASATIVNNTITGNTGTNGGAIYCSKGSMTITDNTIVGNSVSLRGGGIYCSSATVMIAGNTINANSAAWSAGGVYCDSCTGTMVNNTIVGNGANFGGAVGLNSSPLTVANNTIVGNHGPSGAIFAIDSSPVLVNNLIAFNSSGFYMSGLGTPVLRNNCVYGNTSYDYSGVADLTGINGNISVDPELAGVSFGDTHIQPTSPCVDAGDNSVVVDGSWMDLDGQPRIIGAHVDIGADESDGSVWPPGPYRVVRVSPEGDDTNDGSSWPLAKKTVQAGIDAAAEAGGEVWVREGTYLGQVKLRAFTHLYGGFRGVETQRSERDVSADPAILDGQQNGSVVTVNSGAMVSTIDGLTMQNGDAVNGGGIACSVASPTISNNMITGNTASSGGGIHCEYASPVITNNEISGNTATASDKGGGGISCESSSAPTISNNMISGNSALFCGGGVYCRSSTPMITHNLISQNSVSATSGNGGGGGGVFCTLSVSPTIADNVIYANSIASGSGAGINSAVAAQITNNLIIGNTALASGLNGGGIACSSSAKIIGNRILGNTVAGSGSGIHWSSVSPTIANNTIVGNAGAHGALAPGSGSPTIVNNIVAFNSAGFYKNVSGTPVLRNNCVYGNQAYDYSGLTDPTGTNGNIKADPQFADGDYGNVHLQPDSPCLDAGDDSVVSEGASDYDGDNRIIGAHVDIGADESDGTDWPTGPAFIVRVSPNGDDANDGSTWSLAKRTVQAALDVASVHGGEVWVREGTYSEGIALYAYAHAYGGFSGVETERTERNPAAHVAALDGPGVNGFIVRVLGGLCAATIDGFAILGHNVAGQSGIYCYRSPATITNNRFEQCRASSIRGVIDCRDASPVITNNTLVANTGTGVYCERSAATIANNTITSQFASQAAGAVHCKSSSPMIVNNTIAGNTGSGISFDSGSPTVVNNLLAFNGSAIYRAAGTPILRHNCAYTPEGSNYVGLSDPTGADGNINVDPLLAHVDSGNLHIQPDSPCVDAGDDSVVDGSWRDMDNQSRIMGAHVDIGADESDGTVWPPGPSGVVYVSPDGDDADDGWSWSLAKRTVQAGVNAAALRGAEVWVRSGTYFERIQMQAQVRLYGGFSGGESERDQRDWTAHVTILDGQRSGRVVTVIAGNPTGRIDGFTIRNGKPDSNGYGGGISAAGLTIANNIITGNTAYGGGGVSCSSSAVLVNNTIFANSAYKGGGVYCGGETTLVNNTIMINFSSTDGGGLYYYSSVTIVNTIVAHNSSGIYSQAGTVTLRHNCVYGNGAYDYSGLPDPTGTDGNINLNPQLDAVAYGGWHLQPSSPCVDAGDSSIELGEEWDIDHQARVIGERVDIGADESNGENWATGPRVVVRVSPDGSDTNDGLSWTFPKRTLQAGIDAAAAVGGQVWVMSGIYSERITLRPHAHVFGGFAGHEAAQDQRNWTAYYCILDGQAGGSVVTSEAPGYLTSTLDGFIVTNGSAAEGGGVHCFYSAPGIANNVIGNNTASVSGGGIFCKYAGPLITRNTITTNSASSGGGIYCTYASPLIADNTISTNSASFGGGLYCDRSSPAIADNEISGNNATTSGGGIYCAVSSPRITGSVLSGNIASSWGGGLCSDSGSDPIVADTSILGNNAGSGGGICAYSRPEIVNTRISGNVASLLGGGIYSAHAVAITNSVIDENRATSGGGVYLDDGLVMVMMNTVVRGNSASSAGGGIYVASPRFGSRVAGSTLVGNVAPSGGAIYCTTTRELHLGATIVALNSSGIHMAAGTGLLARYNCVYANGVYNFHGVPDPTGTVGNMSVDPRFVISPDAGPDGIWGTADDNPGDLRLSAGSPCIDAGDDYLLTDFLDLDGDGDTSEPVPFDLAGANRFVDDPATPDTGAGTPPIVDMGAYEYIPRPQPVTLISAASRKQHQAAGVFEVNLPLPFGGQAGVECRAGGPTHLVLTFSGPAAGASVQTSAGTIDEVTVNGSEVIVALANTPNPGYFTLAVVGVEGLDGEVELHIGCLTGDTNADGVTNILDLVQTRNVLDQSVTGSNFRADVTADGVIDIHDLLLIRANLNTTLGDWASTGGF